VRILYVGSRYDYGDLSRGLSFEHYNFHDTLVHMGHNITYFDAMAEYQQRGRTQTSIRLRDIVRSEKPDLLFCVLFTDQFDVDTMRDISQHTETVTYNWFCDDHWRFDNYSQHWAPAFNWVSTTAASALPKYERLGYTNVIKTQWACNHFLYKPLSGQTDHDVTFVGQPHGTRRRVIEALKASGIQVQTWGHGWENGRLSQQEMIEMFGRSRINLNLSNASTTGQGRSRWFTRNRKSLAQQIKGRNFEIPGCGGFLLTDLAENLQDYYLLGQEVATFMDNDELIAKVRYYLDHESERQRIAKSGYMRTLTDHTYERRFTDIFTAMGFKAEQIAGPVSRH